MEIRTTVHTDLLNENDINEMIKYLDEIGYRSNYFIQNFRNDHGNLLSELPNQTCVLNKNKIISPKNFSIKYRNFF